MTSFNTKAALSILAVALVATPALAQRQQHQQHQQQTQNQSAPGDVGTYPNGATKTGSAAAQDSGADFNLER